MILLSLIEVAIIAISITLESTKKVFISKTFYCLWILYHALFILLNLSLQFGEACDTIYPDSYLKSESL